MTLPDACVVTLSAANGSGRFFGILRCAQNDIDEVTDSYAKVFSREVCLIVNCISFRACQARVFGPTELSGTRGFPKGQIIF